MVICIYNGNLSKQNTEEKKLRQLIFDGKSNQFTRHKQNGSVEKHA